MDQQTVRDLTGEEEASVKQLSGRSQWPAEQREASNDQAEQQGQERGQSRVELEPVAVYSCDAAGVITFYNERAVQLWGRRPEIGDTDERFCGSHKLYRIDGTHMPHEHCPMADVLSGKASGVHDAEVHIERPDGTRVGVVVNIVPLIDDRGVIVGAMNSFYDVADRRHVEGASATQLAR